METDDPADQEAVSYSMSQVYDICHDVIVASLTPEEAFERIKALKESCGAVSSMLVDALCTVEGEVDKSEEDQFSRFKRFILSLVDTVVAGDIINAEIDILEGSSIDNKKQLVRTKTKLFFKQTKFNLLREESEGYAKLITELFALDDSLSTSQLVQRIYSLIGTFSLDPNRVVDIVLEAAERCHSKLGLLIALIKEMRASESLLLALLVFKFTQYQAAKTDTPFSLHRLTAALIGERLIKMEDIARHLSPGRGEAVELHKARAALASVRSKKAEVIVASGIAVDSNKSSLSMDGPEESNITGVCFSAVMAVQDAEDIKLRGSEEDEAKKLGMNQKVGLATALLEAFNWDEAKKLMDCLPEFHVVQFSRRASCALADMMDASIDDFYRLKCLPGLRDNNGDRKDKRKWDRKMHSWTDLSIIFELSSYLGPRIAYRAKTFTKLIRLLSIFYEERKVGVQCLDEELSNQVMDMIDDSLLPALSLSDCNVAISEEMWNLVKYLTYGQRYRLYGRWKTEHTMRHPELVIEKGKTIGRTKYVVKRLCKETVKVMGRILGKLAHTYPSFVFNYLLDQVQTFDNLIHPVVEALRFLSTLELDVLMFSILEQLSSPDKESLKSSDGTTSNWLSSLATLIGALLKKYPIEMDSILHYVINQLKQGKSADLLVLNEILHAMAGVEKATQATNEHIEAMRGGETLRMEAGSYGVSRNKKAFQRLKEALAKDDIVIGLSIMVAQQRDEIIYSDLQHPLKLTGEQSDECRDTLIQLGQVMSEVMKQEDYVAKMPSFISLLNDYFLPFDAAAFLSRSSFMHNVYSLYSKAKKEMRGKKLKDEKEKEEEGEETDKEKKKELDAMVKSTLFNSAMDEIVNKLAEDIDPFFASLCNADMIRKTFVLFWMLSPYDIDVPVCAYERERDKIRKAISSLPDNPDMTKNKAAREEERLRNLEKKLKEEERKQKEHVENVKAYLEVHKKELFSSLVGNCVLTFLQSCVLPRSMFSEADALFSAKFIIVLQLQQTAHFQTLLLNDRMFSDVLPIVALLSENEATSLGRCLQTIMSQHADWHNSKQLFAKYRELIEDCNDTPGFYLKVKKAQQTDEHCVNHDMHAKLLYKWQSRLFKSFQGALNNQKADYVHLRNSLLVMISMLPCFPLVTDHSQELEKCATELKDREKGVRNDLSLKAATYAGQLKKRKVTLHDASYFNSKARPKPSPPTAVSDNKKKEEASSEMKKEVKTEVEENGKEKNGEVEKKSDTASTEKANGTSSGEKTRKKREAEDGGVARSILLKAKRLKNELEMMDAKDKDKKPVDVEEKKRVELNGKKEKKNRGEESEEGEVPPSPPSKKEDERNGKKKGEKGEKKDKKEDGKEKENKDKREEGKERREEKREERKEKKEKRSSSKDKEDRRERVVEGPMPPPKKGGIIEERREKRKTTSEENVSTKKMKRDKERDKSDESRGSKRTLSPSRSSRDHKQKRKKSPDTKSRRVHNEISF